MFAITFINCTLHVNHLLTDKNKYTMHLNLVFKPYPATFIEEAFATVFYPYLISEETKWGKKCMFG